jgi:hypothetical protein
MRTKCGVLAARRLADNGFGSPWRPRRAQCSPCRLGIVGAKVPKPCGRRFHHYIRSRRYVIRIVLRCTKRSVPQPNPALSPNWPGTRIMAHTSTGRPDRGSLVCHKQPYRSPRRSVTIGVRSNILLAMVVSPDVQHSLDSTTFFSGMEPLPLRSLLILCSRSRSRLSQRPSLLR